MTGRQREPPSISIPEEILAKTKEQITFLSQYGITQESFREAVEEKIAGGLSFVLAVYRTFDEFFEKEFQVSGVTLACKKGCSNCCHTLITCTEMEFNEAIHFIGLLPKHVRFPLLRRLRQFARDWRDYYRANERRLNMDPFASFNEWEGRPCPFLNEEDGSCAIYPVRIMDCRTLTSLIPCVSPVTEVVIPCELHTEGPGRYRFQGETWANNLIAEEQQRKLGLPDPRLFQSTPVHHWLWIKRKEF